MSELKPCLFCGSFGKMTSTTFGDSNIEYYRIECGQGHALDCWDDTEEEAFDTWNTRKPEWIKVSERLPEEATFVLVYGSHAMPWLCEFINGLFKDIEDGDYLTGITHWQPLPDPPKD